MDTPQVNRKQIDDLRAWFFAKDRHPVLADNLWVISRQLAWETAVSKFQYLPGLVGFWPMSSVQRSTGNVADLGGQQRTLTYNGNPTFNVYNNLVPYAELDGTGDFFSRADETDLDILGTETIYGNAVRGLTCGGWYWIDTIQQSGLISKNNGTGNQRSYMLFLFGAGTPANNVSFQVSSTGTDQIRNESGIVPVAQAWYFFVGRYVPGRSLDVYIGAANGFNKYTFTTGIPAAVFNSTASLEIGSFTAGTSVLDGRVSLQFLCANALTDALVSSLFYQTRSLFGI